MILVALALLGCKSIEINDNLVSQRINRLSMNIYSSNGKKFITIKSPYSNYNKETNILNLKQTTIYLYKDGYRKYIINADKSQLSNNNKLLELNGNVIIKTLIKEEEELYSNNFSWNIEDSEFLLLGNVKFDNKEISLNSNKAILNKKTNVIEFFNPVKYKVNDQNKSKYEVNSENAYYNIETKSVSFSSKDQRVRSKIYF